MGISPVSPRRFTLLSEVKEGIVVLICNGRLTAEVSSDFKVKVKPLLEAGSRVILDMGAVTHVDSSGLGAVVSVYTTARSAGCHFQISNLTEPVKRIFGLTRVLGAFESCGAYLARMP